MTAKECLKVDLNTFSGSRETFRTSVGGYWQIVSSSEGEQLEAVDFDPDDILNNYITEITSNVDLVETRSDSVIIPNYKFPIRLVGDDDKIKDDNHWKRILMGGTFEEVEYSKIFKEDTYDDFSFSYSLPYTQQEQNAINYVLQSTTDISNTISISYDYNHYLPLYEQYINGVNEKLIPNMYLLNMYYLEDSLAVDENIRKFVTLEDTYESVSSLLSEVGEYIDTDGYMVDMEDSLIYQYYTSSIPTTPLSASTIESINNKFQNIIFDNNILTDVTAEDLYSQMGDYSGMIPFYMKFNWTPDHEQSTFVDIIEDNEFVPKFMKTLKEVFNADIDTFMPTINRFVVQKTFKQGSVSDETVTDYITANNGTYRSANFMKMLSYAHSNFLSNNDNCYFLGPRNIKRKSVMDTVGSYRYLNTNNTLGVINDTLGYLEDTSNFNFESIDDIYSLSGSYKETLAYRIQKVGGPGTGDSATQETLQNFWFFNTADFMEGSEFYDSQIKYDTDYKYNVYAYVLVVGRKYSFSDLRLTRQLGDTLLVEDTDTSSDATYLGSLNNCLEFYAPDTDAAAVQLFSEDTNLADYNSFATNAQIYSENKYLADFYLNYEPTLKIIEVPIYSKTLRAMDHIPNKVNITPYQFMDTSQRVGFTVDYQVYENALSYPSTINTSDLNRKRGYLNANDLLSTDYLSLKSVSEQRFLSVYRLDERPTSVLDFAGNILDSFDLRDSEDKQNNSTIEISDVIGTNKKYYYIFRIENEQAMVGHLSDIYEVQLINDGGYIYSIFNVLFESDLQQDKFIEPSKDFKKIFQLRPNISQLTLNTDDVSFTEPAYSQLENMTVGSSEDLIWGKEFKIRLTSKKTGKKIDLNFTYNLTTD